MLEKQRDGSVVGLRKTEKLGADAIREPVQILVAPSVSVIRHRERVRCLSDLQFEACRDGVLDVARPERRKGILQSGATTTHGRVFDSKWPIPAAQVRRAQPADERDTGAACAKAPRMKSIYQLISVGVNGPFARTIALLAIAVLMTTTAAPVFAQEQDPYKTGVWHYKSIPCIDTTVVAVTPRLGSLGQTKFSAADFQQTGVSVTFKTTLGSDPALPPSRVAVTHYQGDADNKFMIAERPGDKVQVCWVSTPAPSESCDPDKDPRGRNYRIWDYRQQKQYSGGSQHGCGGA